MEIRVITNRNPGFYTLMGPFLARRNIENEIGYRIYDDDDKEWFVALQDDRVVGFCYRQRRSEGRYLIGSCYVVEAYRNQGVFRSLFDAATEGIKGTVSMTTRSDVVRDFLLAQGFTAAQTKGSFTEYKKVI